MDYRTWNMGWNPMGNQLQEEYYRQQEGKAIWKRGMGLGFGVVGMEVVSSVFASVLMLLLSFTGLMNRYQDPNFWYLSQEVYYIVYSVLYLVMVVAPFALLIPIFRLQRKQFLPLEHSIGAVHTLALIAIGFGVCMVSNYMTNLYVVVVEEGFGLVTEFPESDPGKSVLARILYFATVAILPPLAEEFSFRGVALGALRPYGDGFAILGSAFLFAIMHGNLVQIPFAFLCGLILGYITVCSGSIWPAVAVHFLNNGFSVMQELLPQTNGNMILIYVIYAIAMIAAVVAAVWLVRRESGAFAVRQAEFSRLSEKQKFGKFVANPGMIVAFASVLIKIIMMTSFVPKG